MASIKFEIGKDYTYSTIDTYAMDNNYNLISLCENQDMILIGENFLVLKQQDKDKTHSFVLTGASATELYYTCIYSDK